MKKTIFCALLIALTATFARPQDQSPAEYKKFEIYGGYSANNLLGGNPEELVDANARSTPTYRGWNASAVYNLNRFIGVKTDVSGHYKKFTLADDGLRVRADASFYNYLAGIQLKDNKRSKRFSPFLHALGGVASSRSKISLPNLSESPAFTVSQTGGSMVFGGGIDLKLNRRFSVRLIQADYNPTFLNGKVQQNVRLGFGIVFH